LADFRADALFGGGAAGYTDYPASLAQERFR
jgi:hypothetical protein